MIRVLISSWMMLAVSALPSSKSITLPGSQEWVDTGVDVKAGDVYQF